MKNSLFLSIALITLSILFSCNKITPPYTEDILDTTKIESKRKVLMEDFTGFRCGNCPAAGEIAQELKRKYAPNVILLAVHAGYYAKPSGNKTYDFRTKVGDELDAFFGCSAAGNPSGMVNRVGFPNKTHILREGQWEAKIIEQLKTKPIATIVLETSIDTLKREIQVSAKIKYLAESTSNDHLCIYIAEDSIVQYQRDDRKNPPDIYDYVHNNVLRGSITSTFGEQISNTPIPKDAEFIKSYNYSIPPEKDWRLDKIKIIAFIHEKDGSFEVLQVEESYPKLK